MTYPDQLFLKAQVVMILRGLHTPHELLTVLGQPTLPIGRYPSRRTWERRLAARPSSAI